MWKLKVMINVLKIWHSILLIYWYSTNFCLWNLSNRVSVYDCILLLIITNIHLTIEQYHCFPPPAHSCVLHTSLHTPPAPPLPIYYESGLVWWWEGCGHNIAIKINEVYRNNSCDVFYLAYYYSMSIAYFKRRVHVWYLCSVFLELHVNNLI